MAIRREDGDNVGHILIDINKYFDGIVPAILFCISNDSLSDVYIFVYNINRNMWLGFTLLIR